METDSSSWCWFVLIISYTVVNFINSPQYRYNPHIRAFFSSCSTKWSPANYLCCPKVQGIKHTHYHQNGTGLCYQAIWQSIWQGQIEYDPQYHYAKLHEWAASKYMFQYSHHHQLYPEIPASKWRQLSWISLKSLQQWKWSWNEKRLKKDGFDNKGFLEMPEIACLLIVGAWRNVCLTWIMLFYLPANPLINGHCSMAIIITVWQLEVISGSYHWHM